MNRTTCFEFDKPRPKQPRFSPAYFAEIAYQWSQYEAYQRWRYGLPPKTQEQHVQQRVEQDDTNNHEDEDRKSTTDEGTRRWIVNGYVDLTRQDSAISDTPVHEGQKEDGEIDNA